MEAKCSGFRNTSTCDQEEPGVKPPSPELLSSLTQLLVFSSSLSVAQNVLIYIVCTVRLLLGKVNLGCVFPHPLLFPFTVDMQGHREAVFERERPTEGALSSYKVHTERRGKTDKTESQTLYSWFKLDYDGVHLNVDCRITVTNWCIVCKCKIIFNQEINGAQSGNALMLQM